MNRDSWRSRLTIGVIAVGLMAVAGCQTTGTSGPSASPSKPVAAQQTAKATEGITGQVERIQ